MAFGLHRSGEIESRSDTERSLELLTESLSLYEAIGARHGVAGVLLHLSVLASYNADFGEEERLARSSLSALEEFGHPLEIVEALRRVAFSVAMQGRIEEGMQIGRQYLTIAHNLGKQYSVDSSFWFAGLIRSTGQVEEAYRRYGEVKVACEDIGSHTMLLSAIFWQARAGLHLGNYRQYLSIAADQRDKYASRYMYAHLALGRGAAHLALGQPEDSLEESTKAVETFRLGGLRPALSRSLATLALVLRAVGDVVAARESLSEALQLAIEMRSPPVLCYSLPAAALLLADQGDNVRAVAIYALALQNPNVANSRWFYDVAGKEIEAIAESLPPAVAEAAKAKGAEMDLWATAEELLDEFHSTPGRHSE
jgi:hypothetical protein